MSEGLTLGTYYPPSKYGKWDMHPYLPLKKKVWLVWTWPEDSALNYLGGMRTVALGTGDSRWNTEEYKYVQMLQINYSMSLGVSNQVGTR